ncbi:unnamed protein product, partial [Prorocentrum cordatum]
GLTFLEVGSVSEPTRADCERRQLAFSRRAQQRVASLATPPEVGQALVQFSHEEFLDGGESSDAWKRVAAPAFSRPELPTRQGRLPRAARSAKEWSRFAPPRSRLPLPWLVGCLFVEELSRQGLAVDAALTALLQLIPHGLTSATSTHHLRMVRHLFERQTPSKTGVLDESLRVDSLCFPWVANLMAELRRRTPAGHRLFSATYAQWNYHSEAATVRMGLGSLGSLTLRQLRRGGASHELHAAAPPLKDIQKRGRWATDAALRLCATGGRAQGQLHRLPRTPQLQAEQAYRRIGDTLLETLRRG